MRGLWLIFLALLSYASTLHLAISASPSKLNPLIATDSASGEIAGWIFNGLFKYDANATIVGDLARKWRFLDERRLWVELRDNVSWHDGEPFEADDVKFTFELITSSKVVTPYASEFRYVQDVDIIDPHHLIITYKRPYFKALQTWMLGIVPRHLLSKEQNIMTSSFNQRPVGTGPYKLEKFEVSKDIELFANERYFLHPPRIPKIVYHFLPDPSTQFLMLKQKKLDVGSLTPLQLERQIDEDFKAFYEIYEMPSHGYTYLGFNLKNPKFQDRRVREALNLAVDRQEIIDILFFSHASVCTGPFMPGTFAYDPTVQAPKRDLARARGLLKEAGYDQEHPLEFEIATNSNNTTRLYAAQIIQQQLAQIGVKVRIRAMEWQAFLNTVVMPRRFETVLLGWGLGLTPDAYAIWHSEGDRPGGFNFIGYKNPEVDRLIKEAETTIDHERLARLYKKIFRLIVQDIPYLFLYIPNSITAVNKAIKNVEPSIVGVMHNEIEWIKP
ncbi:MAG: peptide ABC transporter substrate-binding protein [Epsilonproteobacteria bacterium]|nr:peptide ABC transporter substrate-binding protein [Campylobacterota bacterium]NPA63885.1 peptide ABC transporter substrate-binding protein [Campylobacterota bacterium]